MLDLQLLLPAALFVVVIISTVSSFQPLTTSLGVPRGHSLTDINSDALPRRQSSWGVALRSSLPSGEDESSSSSSASSSFSSSSSSSKTATSVRFLGRGKNAIVRPGVVLVAPPDEFHHFLRQAAVFIYAMGQDDDDVYVIRGAIVDHPTPFTIHEMMPDGAAALNGELTEEETAAAAAATTPQTQCLQNLVYRGGERGDSVYMLHSDPALAKEADQEMIGSTGVFQGGLNHALSTEYSIDPQKAKFFFSYMEFTEAELEEMLENREEDSTQWVSVEVPPEFVLNSEWERGEAWARLRNAIREM